MVILTGKPNTGKSTVAQRTGAKVLSGNWHGSTTGTRNDTGRCPSGDPTDTPGVSDVAEMAALTRRLSNTYKLGWTAINLVDTTDIKRSLCLTLALLDMTGHVVVALNKWDLLPQKKKFRSIIVD